MIKGSTVFTSELQDFGSKLWRYHIKVPKKIAKQYIDGKNRRVICSLNGLEAFHTSIMHAGDEIFFINVNAQWRKRLNIQEGDKIEVEIAQDHSKYGMKVCKEFATSLKMDAEANVLFHKLTPGKQRNLIYIANQPKKSQLRLNKSLIILEFLKLNDGKLDFKMLYQALKEK